MADSLKQPLLGISANELKRYVREMGLPGYTVDQIADWIYKKNVRNLSEMTNLSRHARNQLEERFDVGIADPVELAVSKDGTRKYLFEMDGPVHVETAYIPERTRATLCVSTQAGCARACRFCMTGLQGLQRNLSPNEILNQYAAIPERDTVTNIVYMGMGEPLDNLDSVLESLEILTSESGYGLSPRRITVSTVGITPQFQQLYKASGCNIAVSLHSPWPEERARIMPVENRHPVKKVLDFLKDEQRARKSRQSRRKISFEYVLFSGVNDTVSHAKEIVRLLHGIRCRVNLIRFNAGVDSDFTPAGEEAAARFRDTLAAKGITATVRKSRGQDIQAACGLLSTQRLL